MAQDCEKYIGEWNEADGFFGANCGTWFGGFSANCKTQAQAAHMNRQNCYNVKSRQSRNDQLTEQIIDVGKLFVIAGMLFFIIKWYMK